MSRRLVKILLLLSIAAAAYYLYRHDTAAPADSAHAAGGEGPPVSVAEVLSRKVELWNEFSGRLVAVASAEIRPQVSGVIEKVQFTEGQWVEKNQPIFTIDQRAYAAALQAAKARAEFTEAELARAKSLLADKALPQREYDQRKNDAEIARAELTRAELNMDYTLVKTPIAGRVGRAEITAGNLVDGGGNAPVLTTVVANRPIYADFNIDEESYLNYLQAAGSDPEKLRNIAVNLLLSGQDASAHAGRVQSFDNRLDTGSGTLRVRAIFDNEDGSLIPGLFARIQLGSASSEEAILITDRAINTDQNVKFVWVVGDDNKVSYRPVTLGPMANGLRVIKDGLKPGEKIAINGIQRVMMPGQAITPHIVEMDAPPEPPTP